MYNQECLPFILFHFHVHTNITYVPILYIRSHVFTKNRFFSLNLWLCTRHFAFSQLLLLISAEWRILENWNFQQWLAPPQKESYCFWEKLSDSFTGHPHPKFKKNACLKNCVDHTTTLKHIASWNTHKELLNRKKY